MAQDSVTVFISYSHADEEYRRKLGSHLAPLRREKLITEWHDRKIEAGAEWDEEIKSQLNSADIILLLLSAEFVESDYVADHEIPAALERHDRGEAVVIPVHLRTFVWSSNDSFAKLQSYPTNAKPVAQWEDAEKRRDKPVRCSECKSRTVKT